MLSVLSIDLIGFKTWMEKCGKKKMWIAKKVKRIKRETQLVDCKTVGFFLKISKEIGKAWRKNLTRAKRASLTRPSGERKSVSPQSRSLFSASFQTFCLTARAYLNTQKYGLFCSLRSWQRERIMIELPV